MLALEQEKQDVTQCCSCDMNKQTKLQPQMHWYIFFPEFDVWDMKTELKSKHLTVDLYANQLRGECTAALLFLKIM